MLHAAAGWRPINEKSQGLRRCSGRIFDARSFSWAICRLAALLIACIGRASGANVTGKMHGEHTSALGHAHGNTRAKQIWSAVLN